MNLRKMIAELQAERDRLEEAILALERLSALGHGRTRISAEGRLRAAAAAGRGGASRSDASAEAPSESESPSA